jgi:hypothetical protein
MTKKHQPFHQPNSPHAQTATDAFTAKQHEKQHQGRPATPVGPLPHKSQSREATGGYHHSGKK